MLLAAAAAAANAVKGLAPQAPSLPAPPSVPNLTEALRSGSEAASKLSLPEAPSIPSVPSDSTGLQQVCSGYLCASVSCSDHAHVAYTHADKSAISVLTIPDMVEACFGSTVRLFSPTSVAQSFLSSTLTCLHLLQAIGLAAAEAIAALVAANIVGSLTAKKSGRKAYGK